MFQIDWMFVCSFRIHTSALGIVRRSLLLPAERCMSFVLHGVLVFILLFLFFTSHLLSIINSSISPRYLGKYIVCVDVVVKFRPSYANLIRFECSQASPNHILRVLSIQFAENARADVVNQPVELKPTFLNGVQDNTLLLDNIQALADIQLC